MANEDLIGVGKAIAPLTEGFSSVCSKLFSKSADKIGEILAEWIGVQSDPWRIKNLLGSMEKTNQILVERGIKPAPISKKLVYQFLDGASKEEDETLQQLWAGLLATALQGHQTHPAYPTILEQITPLEARILNILFLESKNPLSEVPVAASIRAIPLYTLLSQESLTEQSLMISTGNLCRQNLCTLEPVKSLLETYEEALETPKAFAQSIPDIKPPVSPFRQSTSRYPEIYEQKIQLSPLGYAFVTACQP
jgi:hypothetical protein